jgi:transcriptional regulatory protein LevR
MVSICAASLNRKLLDKEKPALALEKQAGLIYGNWLEIDFLVHVAFEIVAIQSPNRSYYADKNAPKVRAK